MIKHHPSTAVLRAHALGELSDGFALAVATHISLCPSCQAAYDQFEASTSELLLMPDPLTEPPMDGHLDEILQSILNEQVHPELRDRRATPRSSKLKVNGESFEVPWPLQRIAGKIRSWELFGEQIHIASLSLESEAHRISFLYVCADSEIPPQVLDKNEFTMILAGSLHDQHGQYRAGDFIVPMPDENQSFCTGSQESCLCLSVLSEPLRLNRRLEQQPLPYFKPLRQAVRK